MPVSGAASHRIGILIGAGAQVFVDGAHVGHLQSPAKLNAEEAEAHVPDLPISFARLLHRRLLHKGRGAPARIARNTAASKLVRQAFPCQPKSPFPILRVRARLGVAPKKRVVRTGPSGVSPCWAAQEFPQRTGGGASSENLVRIGGHSLLGRLGFADHFVGTGKARVGLLSTVTEEGLAV